MLCMLVAQRPVMSEHPTFAGPWWACLNSQIVMPACPLSCSPWALISRCFIAKQAATTDKQTDGTGIQPARPPPDLRPDGGAILCGDYQISHDCGGGGAKFKAGSSSSPQVEKGREIRTHSERARSLALHAPRITVNEEGGKRERFRASLPIFMPPFPYARIGNAGIMTRTRSHMNYE